MNTNWHRVSKNEPCPVCQHTDWCMLSNDGEVCICQRVESDRPTKNSGGWVHRLGNSRCEKRMVNNGQRNRSSCAASPLNGGRGATALPPDDGRAGSPLPAAVGQQNENGDRHCPPPPAFSPIAEYFAALPTTWHNAQTRLCAYLEAELGLPKEIMAVLDWRWDRTAKAVAIPMRDAWGEVTGIRYRALKTGTKWAKRGSKDGLFFDPEFIPWDPEELVVCEGPTDCAAAMACGFWAVGRSSCGTGRDAIRELIRRKGARRVTIVADDDKPKPKPGGGTWRPGLEGAQRLAESLGCAYRIVLPPHGFKDLREWYRAGTLNEKSFKAMCQGTDWSGPGR